MADIALPFEQADPRPLRSLFLDLNSYFASVEQAEDPSLRGRPVAVIPLLADTTFCIAASYEAKAYGVKTGTRVDEAKAKCPDLVLIISEAPKYTHYHQRILEAAESVLPVEKVCSIDEMRFALLGSERSPDQATSLAKRIKSAIQDGIAPNLTSSIGIAPNAFLAKLATEMEKPDGLVLLTTDQIEPRATQLRLTDFPGINRRMAARLNASGIYTAADLYNRSAKELRIAFGSVLGERWYYLLRGFELDEPEHPRKSISHSHVLPPEYRNPEGSHQVLLRLTTKAMLRLRRHELRTSQLSIKVKNRTHAWTAEASFSPTQSTQRIIQKVESLWPHNDITNPTQVSIVLGNLVDPLSYNPSLFDEPEEDKSPDQVIDTLNQRFGKNTVYLASIHRTKDTASEKIAFHKTELLSEGKEDNIYVNTRTAESHPLS